MKSLQNVFVSKVLKQTAISSLSFYSSMLTSLNNLHYTPLIQAYESVPSISILSMNVPFQGSKESTLSFVICAVSPHCTPTRNIGIFCYAVVKYWVKSFEQDDRMHHQGLMWGLIVNAQSEKSLGLLMHRDPYLFSFGINSRLLYVIQSPSPA